MLVEDGVIAQVLRPPSKLRADEVLNAAGSWVMPGFVDLHCHLREPGQEYKEDIETGTLAAAYGGFTGVACMPNTRPVNDDAASPAISSSAPGRAAPTYIPSPPSPRVSRAKS